MRFEGTDSYVATEDLTIAVNAAVTLERPLLVKGEPGTGKTELARQVATSLGLPIIEWHIKSTTRAQQGLYEYDAVSRLRDSQLGEERVHDVSNYIKRGKLWQAFEADGKTVLLIDEIDKADIEFPNDLLQELDRMEFFVYETGQTVTRAHPAHRHHHLEQRKGTAGRLPAPLFLPLHPFPRDGDDEGDRRGAFPRHQAGAPDHGADAILRDPRPAGAEEKALDLRSAGLAEAASGRGPEPEDLRRDGASALPKLHGALLKNEQDVALFERLAFMARRQR
jgi:hypothetical protein